MVATVCIVCIRYVVVVSINTLLSGHVGSMGDSSKASSVCLFVRNLPYTTTDSELEDVFKRHGALRSCYTVKERGEE